MLRELHENAQEANATWRHAERGETYEIPQELDDLEWKIRWKYNGFSPILGNLHMMKMGFKYKIILPWWFHILDADISGLYGYWSKDLVPGWSPKLAGIYGCWFPQPYANNRFWPIQIFIDLCADLCFSMCIYMSYMYMEYYRYFRWIVMDSHGKHLDYHGHKV